MKIASNNTRTLRMTAQNQQRVVARLADSTPKPKPRTATEGTVVYRELGRQIDSAFLAKLTGNGKLTDAMTSNPQQDRLAQLAGIVGETPTPTRPTAGVTTPGVGELLKAPSAEDRLAKVQDHMDAHDPTKAQEEAYAKSRDRSGWAKDDDATTTGEGDKEPSTWDTFKNWVSSVVGSVVGGAGTKTPTGGGAGTVGGTALTVLTSNTDSAEDKANEFRGWAAFVKMSRGEYPHPGMNDVDDETPVPDAVAVEKGSMTDEEAAERARRLKQGIAQPGPDGNTQLPDPDSLKPMEPGSNPRQGWATTPLPDGAGSGLSGDEPIIRNMPGVKDPPEGFGIDGLTPPGGEGDDGSGAPVVPDIHR